MNFIQITRKKKKKKNDDHNDPPAMKAQQKNINQVNCTLIFQN